MTWNEPEKDQNNKSPRHVEVSNKKEDISSALRTQILAPSPSPIELIKKLGNLIGRLKSQNTSSTIAKKWTDKTTEIPPITFRVASDQYTTQDITTLENYILEAQSDIITLENKETQKIKEPLRQVSVLEATNALLQVCDGAVAKDEQGFNSPDSIHIRSILNQQFQPTPGQLVDIHKRLQKYQGQLEDMGIDYKSIQSPVVAEGTLVGNEVADRMHLSAKQYKINFGKHKDQTLEQIAREDIQYLSWLAGTDGDTAKLVKLALNGIALPQQEKPNQTVRLDLENENITIYTPYELANVCKSLSDRKWNPDKKRWHSPKKNLDEVLSTFAKYNPIISPALQAEIDRQNKLKTMSTATEGHTEIKIKNITLMPFQVAGVEFLNITDGKALIADMPGLGKTIQALAYLASNPELRPAIVVCPASLKLNWEREAHKCLWDNDSIYVVNKKIEPASIIIINYDILKKFSGELKLIKAKVIILDESHYIKNYKALRTKTTQSICSGIPHRILLSGTPIMNHPCEIWTQLNIINPEEWDSFFEFGRRYCDATKTQYGWDFKGASNTKELHERLKQISIRRRKLDVLTELPEKQRSMIPLELSNIKEYHEAEQNIIAFIRKTKGDLKASAVSRAEALSKIEELKQIAVRGKIDSVKDYIDTFIESNEKLVIFGWHHDTINILYDKYKDIAVKLTGESLQEHRQHTVDSFQNNPNIKLFIGNLQAAGQGLTLTAASNMAIVELGWNPGIMTQAEDRIHRIGQKNAVTINYLLARNTIEEKIATLLQEKSAIIDAVMEGKDAPEYTILDKLIETL